MRVPGARGLVTFVLLFFLFVFASVGDGQNLHNKEKRRGVIYGGGGSPRHQRCLALLGIFSTAKDAHLRQLHRRYLQAHAPHLAHFGSCGREDSILVRFVLCAKILSAALQSEQEEFGDLIILQSDENMNSGKTLLYFAAAARMSFNSDYILKADIDAFVHAGNLVATLQALQRAEAVYKYYGRIIGGFPVPDKGWIMGCLYGMSFNLVQQYALLAESWTESLRGGEDQISTKIAARFLASSSNASCEWRSDDHIHDHPDCGCGPNAVAFSSQTVAVHQLKALSLWNSTLSYFLGNASAQVVLRDFKSGDFPGLRYRTSPSLVGWESGMTTRRIGRLVLVRHGESMWNITDRAKKRETRFTGWADVPISQLGREQARASGRCMESLKLSFDSVFTSLLHRSRVTYELILQEMPSQIRKAVPVVHSWRLNERHYGALVGLSKSEAEEKMGREKVLGWRRSWNLRPPPMTMHPFYHSISSDPLDKAPLFDWQSEIWTKALTIRSIQMSSGKLVEEEKKHDHNAVIPKTESLEDTSNRVYTLWVEDILPRLVKGSTVLVVGHSNTIRSMVKQLDNLDEHHIMEVVIPSAIPLVYTFAQEPGGVVRPLGKPGTSGMRGRFVVTKELLELNLAASQNLEMSEFLDEGTDFKNMISDTLNRVRGSGAGGVRSSFMDADINAAVGKHSSVMEAGWMTFDNSQENQRKLQRIEKEDEQGVSGRG